MKIDFNISVKDQHHNYWCSLNSGFRTCSLLLRSVIQPALEYTLKKMDALLFADDDVDLLLLYDVMNGRGPLGPRQPAHRFRLMDLSDELCLNNFRFDANSVIRLRDALHFPAILRCPNGTLVEADEALCILLRRLVYPNCLCDLQETFHRTTPELSMIFNTSLQHVYRNYRGLLTNLDHWWLDQHHLQTYATAISTQGAPLQRCWGFIDGTLRPICRPGQDQQEVYNGHKRVHGLKFQSVVIPNGLVANLYGPMEGRRHDSAMLAESQLLDQLDLLFQGVNNQELFYLYGDPAYPLRPALMAPYRGAILDEQQQQFNHQMNRCRQSVEWGFCKIIQNFAFLDYKKNLKLYLQPVGMYYIVGAILTNCHTCLYGSQTGAFFGVQPPNLEEYLNGQLNA